jgi:23S rRNA (pseudouridine1915-N3)-methyltransferase
MSQGDKVLEAEDLAALTGGSLDGSVTVLLDEDGQLFSSEQFAEKLRSLRDDPQVKHLTIVIGGPFGFSAELKQATKMRWSLSKALMPSDLATVVFLEQLYRGFSILKGTGYHHP